MHTAPELSVVVPAFNEERQVAPAIHAVLDALDLIGVSFEVVAVDDGSTDGTAEVVAGIARTDRRVALVRHVTNQGLGASYVTGVSQARGTFVTWVPGDNAIPPEAVRSVVAARSQADIVIGYPVFDRPRAFPRAALSVAYVRLMNVLSSSHIRYYNCITLMRRELLLTVLTGRNRGFGVFAEVLVRLLRGGYSFVEVPVRSRSQPMEGSKAFRWRNVLSVCGQTLRLGWAVLRGRV